MLSWGRMHEFKAVAMWMPILWMVGDAKGGRGMDGRIFTWCCFWTTMCGILRIIIGGFTLRVVI